VLQLDVHEPRMHLKSVGSSDSMVTRTTCSLLRISSKRTSNVKPNVFFGRSMNLQPEIVIRIGSRPNKLLISVRELNVFLLERVNNSNSSSAYQLTLD
jgi:hypothetical protein